MRKRSIKLSLFRTRHRDSYYHVVLRVNRLETLAETAKDRRALNEITIDTLRRFDIKLHAYCLMPSHLRALIEIDDRVIIEAMRRVAQNYSRHRKLTAAGQLFERPYTARRLSSDAAFLELLRYIHLSPVIANKVATPRDYPWSSHRAYLGFKSNALITTEYGLSLLNRDPVLARAAYNRFISDSTTIDVSHTDELSADEEDERPSETELLLDETDAYYQSLSNGESTAASVDVGLEATETRRVRFRRLPRQFLSIY